MWVNKTGNLSIKSFRLIFWVYLQLQRSLLVIKPLTNWSFQTCRLFEAIFWLPCQKIHIQFICLFAFGSNMIHLNYSNQFQFSYVVWKIVILLYIKAIVFSVSLCILDICSPSSDIKSSSGSIRSPGLPRSLSGDLECRWNLNFPVGYNTLVEFSWFGMTEKGRWYKAYTSYWPFCDCSNRNHREL